MEIVESYLDVYKNVVINVDQLRDLLSDDFQALIIKNNEKIKILGRECFIEYVCDHFGNIEAEDYKIKTKRRGVFKNRLKGNKLDNKFVDKQYFQVIDDELVFVMHNYKV